MAGMLRCLVSALLVCGWLSAASSGASTPDEPVSGVPGAAVPEGLSTLVVVLHWEQDQPPGAIAQHFETQLGELLNDLDLDPRFVTLDEAVRRTFPGKIVVLRLSELGEDARRHLPAVPRKALAWTHAANGEVTPFGAVDLVALRRFTGIPASAASTAGGRQEAFARALGRVAAHEIYHMLTRSMEHDTEGIMQPGLTRQQLTSQGELKFTSHNRDMAQRAFRGDSRQDVFAAVTADDDHRNQ